MRVAEDHFEANYEANCLTLVTLDAQFKKKLSSTESELKQVGWRNSQIIVSTLTQFAIKK